MDNMTIYGLEKLEDRVLLAVDINLNNGTLTITGDGEDQAVYITQDGDDILIYAVDADGYEYEVYDADDVKNIVINTNGGDDYVNIPELDISGNVTIDTGSGDDFVQIEADVDGYFGDYGSNFQIGGSLSIKTGDGSDAVDVGDAEIAKNVTVSTGDDNDYVSFFSDSYDLEIGGKTKINLGDGDYDRLTVAAYNGYDVHFDGKVEIKSSSDYTVIVAYTDYGELTFHDDVKVDLKDGEDSFTYIGSYGGEVNFEDKFEFKGGDGDDYVYIYASGYDINFDDIKLDGKHGDNELLIAEGAGDVDVDGKVKVKHFDYV